MKLPVIVLITYLIAFVVITGVAYFILERRRIKKALEDPAAARHSNLPAPDTVARCVTFVVIFVMFWGLSNALSKMSADISQAIEDGAYTIVNNNGADEIVETLMEHKSSLAYFCDWENDNREIEISLVPKQVNDSTTVTVYLGDESITLTRGKGAEFTGTLGLKAADYEGAVYIVSVETDGVICSESVESNIWW